MSKRTRTTCQQRRLQNSFNIRMKVRVISNCDAEILNIRQAQIRGAIGSPHLLNCAMQGTNDAFRKAIKVMLDFSKALNMGIKS